MGSLHYAACRPYRTLVLVALALAAIAPAAYALAILETHGTLCTKTGNPIFDEELRQTLDFYVPASKSHSVLIVFTQCFGGDCIDDFEGRAKTVALSATSPGQTAEYGGYDNDAAAALKPGAGRTSTTVHNAGIAGKDPSETPTKTAGEVSLEPTSASGPIKGRHVIVYAGLPSADPQLDIAQRNRIKSNFAGKVNTTFWSAGGSAGAGGLGANGWDYPGTYGGLRKAIIAAAGQMSADEQLILFVTDHGNRHIVQKQVTLGGGAVVQIPLVIPPDLIAAMLATEDLEEGAGISFRLPFSAAAGADPTQWDAGAVTLAFEGVDTIFSDTTVVPVDNDDDGRVGPGDFWDVRFVMPEDQLIPVFVPAEDFPLTLNLQSHIRTALEIEQVSFDSGPIPKGISENDEERPAEAGPGPAALPTRRTAAAGEINLPAVQLQFTPEAALTVTELGGTLLFGDGSVRVGGQFRLRAWSDNDADGEVSDADTLLGETTALEDSPSFLLPAVQECDGSVRQVLLVSMDLPAVQSQRSAVVTQAGGLPVALFGAAGLGALLASRRRKARGLLVLLGVLALVAALISACQTGANNPPEGNATVQARVDAVTATYDATGADVEFTGLPYSGSTVEIQ